MKTLLLLRHAKSGWKDATLVDFERPLNGRGLKAAALIGRYLRRKKIRPDLILSSPAERARRTTALVIEAAKLSAELRYDERIYEASAGRLLEIISQIEESANVVLVVGHNPGMEELLAGLTGANESMATAALAHISLEIDRWNKVRERRGQLVWIVKPKELARNQG
jgi:phosphohistidine phosphatase